MKTSKIILAVLGAALAIPLLSRAQPAATGFKRTVLQQSDLSVPGREVVTAIVELAPGAMAGRHTHPGDEISYILEGTVQLTVTGKPPRDLKAGDVFFVPAGVIHDAKNTGDKPARILANFVVEKGKALATPAN